MYVGIVLDENACNKFGFLVRAYCLDERNRLLEALQARDIDGARDACYSSEVDINYTNVYNETPLIIMAQEGDLDGLRLLLRCKGLDLEAADRQVGTYVKETFCT